MSHQDGTFFFKDGPIYTFSRCEYLLYIFIYWRVYFLLVYEDNAKKKTTKVLLSCHCHDVLSCKEDIIFAT